MVRRKSHLGRKRKSNSNTKTKDKSATKQISQIAAELGTDRESNSSTLGENTLEGESLSLTTLPTLHRRSKRSCVTVETTYQCEICHLAFSTEYNLRQHLDYYGDPSYPCKQCGTKFTDKRQLQSHISNAHGRLNPKFTVKCPVCKQTFALSAHLRAHLAHYHENWKESITPEEDPVKYPTKFQTLKSNCTDLIKDGVNFLEDSNTRTKTLEAHLQPKQSVANAFSTKTVENVTTSLAIVSRKRFENKENKSHEKSREEEQTSSTNTQNTDVCRNRLESKYKSEDATKQADRLICVDGENKHDYQNRLKDSENKSNQIIRASEQVPCLNGENSQVLEPPLQDMVNDIESNMVTWGGGQMVRVNGGKKSNFQSRLHVKEDKSVQRSKRNKNSVPTDVKDARLQIVQITPVKPGKPINKGIQSLATTWGVPNGNKVRLSNITINTQEEAMEVGSTGSSDDCDESENFDDITVTADNPENVILLDARLRKNKIVATSIDFQEKAKKNNVEKSLFHARNYEKEIELRKSYSCKDCYVPLIRVRIPETSKETSNAIDELTETHVNQLYTAIPSIVCNHIFASKDMMYRHYQQHHFNFYNNKVHCVCGKRMNGYEALNFHFYRHSQETILTAIKPRYSRAPCKPLEKKFACTGCGAKFWVESCLRNHMYSCKSFIKQKVKKILTNGNNFLAVTSEHTCRVCSTVFVSKEKLMEHKKAYSGTANHLCFFCGTLFFEDRQLKTHIEMAHTVITKAGYTYDCAICHQSFIKKRYERIHSMHIHQAQVPLANNHELATNNSSLPNSDDHSVYKTSTDRCNVCNLVFMNKKRYIDHMTYYNKSELIQCMTCGENFEGQYRAHHHNKTAHYCMPTRMAFTHHCNICKEGFMYMTHLQAHMFHVHISEANITAPVDQNGRNELERSSSQTIDSLLYALRDPDVRTVPGLEYACTICDIRFPTRAHLDAHENDFAKGGEYLCNRCSKTCNTPAMLIDHLTYNHSNKTTHDGIKCRRCNENFFTPKAWVSHVKHFHSTEEPSEFFLEKNAVSTEKSGELRYELIPTNKSISKTIKSFNIASLLDSLKSPVVMDINKSAISKTNAVVPEETKLMADSNEETEKTSFTIDNLTIKLEKPDEDVLIIDDSNEIPDNAIVQKEQSAINDNKQAVKTNCDFDADRVKMEFPQDEQATIGFWNIRQAAKRNSCKNWECATCGYAFRGPSGLVKHEARYSDSGEYMCEVCGRRFARPEFYVEHKLSHAQSENIKFFCLSCNEGFNKYQNVKMHVAHLHPNSLQELQVNDAVQRHKHLQLTLRQSRNYTRPWPYPETDFYHPVLPSFVTASNPQLRTYSRKQNNQSKIVNVEDDATDPKDVKEDQLPRLHTEIFEDEISMIYECPNCYEKYSTVERLNEHLTAVHKFKRDDNELEEASKRTDTHVACNDCDKTFANKHLLETHRQKFHISQSVKVLRKSAPVLKISAPINAPVNPNNKQQPVVVGRLYKLERINIFANPVDCDKKGVTQNVKQIVRVNAQQQKILSAATLKKKINASVQRHPNTVLQLKQQQRLASSIIKKKTLTYVQKNTGIGLQLKSEKLLATSMVKMKAIAHEQKNANTAVYLKQQKLLGTTTVNEKDKAPPKKLKPPTMNSLQLTPLTLAQGQLKSAVPNTVQLKALTLYDVQLKSSGTNTVMLKPVSPNDVKLKAQTGNTILLKPLVPNNVQLKPAVVNHANLKFRTLNIGQQNLPKKTVQENLQVVGQRTKVVKLMKTSHQSVLKHSIPNNVTRLPVASSSSAVIMPIKNVVTEPSSSSASSTNEEFHFMCNTCNLIFKSWSQLSAHKKREHTSSNDQSAGISLTEVTSTNNSVEQLHQFVNSLPTQSENEKNMNRRIPLNTDCESVLLPVSPDSFDISIEPSPNSSEVNTLANPLVDPVVTNLSPDCNKVVQLKVRSLAELVKNVRNTNDRKRKNDSPIDMPATKHAKEIFDPITYQELCNQHNLVI